MSGNADYINNLFIKDGPDVENFYHPERYAFYPGPYNTTSKIKMGLVKLFIDHGADIEAKCRGFTALHLAALTGQDLLVKELLSFGAQAQGVCLVCLNRDLSTDILAELLRRGADPEATDSRFHKSALVWASESGSAEAVRILLEHGAKVNVQDIHGISALRYATGNARTETV